MTDKESPLSDIYTLLGVSQMSPMEGVRTQFYKLTRRIHRELAVSIDLDHRKKLLHDLKFICIAYDILSDPVTRTDYDLRTMGLRGVSMPQTPEEKKPGELGQRLHLKIGELLNVAGLLEASELEIACDMHKAMPEMQFGSFLVKQGFIEEYQLEAVLFAQKLLRKGLITVVQYQAAMEELESSGVGVSETVVERGYVTQSDLDHLEEAEAEAEAELNRPTTAPVYTQPPLQAKPDEQVTSHSNLLAQMLPPGAADNIARASGNGEKSAGMLSKLLSGAQDGDVTTPPSTMGGLLKGAAASGAAAAAEARSAADAYSATEVAPAPFAPSAPGPDAKEHKEPKEGGRKKKNIELHEVPAAFDPALSRGSEDIASDTYEGAAYRDELLKPEDIKDTGELSVQAQPPVTAEQDSFIQSGDGLLTADDSDAKTHDDEILAQAEGDTASSDQLGFIEAESSGVEFQGFVDREDEADDEDEDEDEEEEDEGNITLIDADGAQLVEASMPAAEAEREAQVGVGNKSKSSDSTHERIPAYTWPDSPLMDVDATAAAQAQISEIGQDSADNIPSASKKQQSTTRDKMPAFRPPLHNTFQLDEDTSQQAGEPTSEEADESGERQLVISNAVPSWKDQLDWSSPEAEEEAKRQKNLQQPLTASQESEVVDISRHLDLEAIEPQNKDESDDELKSFLGEEYREDLNELNESGRPLWDVEDDEFIVPSAQKKAAQAAQDEEERQAREKRVSGGWQRLKNPFELQLDSSDRAGQTTGEEAVVEVPEQEALDSSRSATAEFARPPFPTHYPSAEAGDPATSSSDSADSFVEASDSLEPGEEEAYQHQLQASSNPRIVIGLEDADESNEVEPAGEPVAVHEVSRSEALTSDELTIDEPLLEEPVAEDYSMEPPSIEESAEDDVPLEEAIIEEAAIEEAVIDESAIDDPILDEGAEEEQVLQAAVEVEAVVVEPIADELVEEEIVEEEFVEEEIVEEQASEEEASTEEIVDNEVTGEAFVDEAGSEEEQEAANEEIAAEVVAEEESATEEESTPTSEEEVVQPASGDEENQAPSAEKQEDANEATEDSGATSKNAAADDEADSDEKTATSTAGADEETPLARRRRMLGRRHHKGKS